MEEQSTAMAQQLAMLLQQGPRKLKKATPKQYAVKIKEVKLICVACQYTFTDPNPSFNQLNNPVCPNCTMFY